MRVVVVATLVLALVFAGCTAEPELESALNPVSSSTSTTRAATTTSTTATSTSATSTSTTSVNHAPVANLTADLVSGAAPFTVNFTLNGTDLDGDALNWTLVFGDGSAIATGAALPATLAHNFTAAGNYTALLRVTDGVANATANVTLQVSAAAVVVEEVNLCPTDTAAIEIPGAGLYATPMDSLSSPPFSIGSMWIYEESNGMPGLQRNDETMPTSCPTPDTVIF